jgi:hypothetical protein
MVDVARRAHLLGRHVHGRAERLERGGDRELFGVFQVGLDHLGDAEIQHLENPRPVTLSREKEISWLEVTMDDAGSVRARDGLTRLEHVRQHFVEG